MIKPYNYSSKFIERTKVFHNSIEKLFRKMGKNYVDLFSATEIKNIGEDKTPSALSKMVAKDGMFNGIGMTDEGTWTSTDPDRHVMTDGRLGYPIKDSTTGWGYDKVQEESKSAAKDSFLNNIFMSSMADEIEASVKFMLPMEGEVCDIKNYDKSIISLVRSPFKTLALEYPTKKLFVEHETDGVDETLTRGGLEGGCIILVKELKPQERWVMFPFVYNKEVDTWWCEKIAYQMDINDSDIRTSYHYMNIEYDKDTLIPGFDDDIGKHIKADFISLPKEIEDDPVRKPYLDHMGLMCCQTFIDFSIFYNTKNIKKILVSPPKKLNAKRISKGKKPLFEYRILDIHREAIEYGRPHHTFADGRKKRQHMCRGHFKHLKSGTYWWNAHVRGSKNEGVIKKDYKLTG